jgi:hypothetical protein
MNRGIFGLPAKRKFTDYYFPQVANALLKTAVRAPIGSSIRGEFSLREIAGISSQCSIVCNGDNIAGNYRYQYVQGAGGPQAGAGQLATNAFLLATGGVWTNGEFLIIVGKHRISWHVRQIRTSNATLDSIYLDGMYLAAATPATGLAVDLRSLDFLATNGLTYSADSMIRIYEPVVGNISLP